MSLTIGRQGYLGIAIESVAGTAESTPSRFIPFTENTLQDKHEKLVDISSRASRVKDHDSVVGKKWSEGDIGVYMDSLDAGYLFKLAFGIEAVTQVGSSTAYDHLFTPTVSGNSPKTATLWNYRNDGATVRQHAYSCVDQLEIEVTNEDLAIMTASVLGGYPSTVAAPTLSTTSGTIFTWKDLTVQFGTTYAAALAATATKVTSAKIELANNVETIYRSGSAEPDAFVLGELEVTGEYTLFFENDTELNAYRNNDKRCAVFTLNGASLGGGNTEQVKIIIRRMFIEEAEMETDLDGVVAITQTFRAIQGAATDPGFVEVVMRNQKTTAY